MFIFILQSVWLYISELAGKGLDVVIILKFLWFVSPKLIPLVLPLTILVTSLMVFGNLSENYEFAAMKSTGISLQRAMRSLTYFILILSVTAFFFANNVIPYSEYKWLNLRRNIQQFKPSMVIAEGQFNQIGEGFNIKVAEKYGDNNQFLKDVVIHKKEGKAKKNSTVIIAKTGELTSEENSNTLSLILRDGNYYDDIQQKDPKKQTRKPFAKSYFEEYTINIDLTELNNKDVEKENKLSNHNMYNVSELRTEIDSLSDSYTNNIANFAENMHYRTGITKHMDRRSKVIKSNVSLDTLLNLFEPKQQSEIIAIAINNINSTIQTIKAKKTEFVVKTKRLNKYEIALHEKYALAIACIILFFVGAPLGAIIRKGGMGLPMVIAILLFLTYHFIGIFAKNSAEDGTLHPFIATWLSTLILLPLGVWLTYRATTDQGIIDMDAFYQRIKRLFNKKEDEQIIEHVQPLILTQQEKAFVMSRDEHQLKDILKNYRQYNYSEDIRLAALRELKEKGYSELQLKMTGDFDNTTYTEAENNYQDFLKNSKKALLFYGITLLIFIGILVLNVTDIFHISSVNLIVNIGKIILIIGFYFFGIKAVLNQIKFYKSIGKKHEELSIWILVLLFGLLFYLFIHLISNKKMKEELERIQ